MLYFIVILLWIINIDFIIMRFKELSYIDIFIDGLD